MMIAKRIETLLLIGLMAVGLVACGDSSETSESESAKPSESVSAETTDTVSETVSVTAEQPSGEKATVSADEIGITSDELADLMAKQNVRTHDFEDFDEVETQVNLGAKMAFDSDSIDFTYTARANELCGLVVWSDNYNDADIAAELINGNTDMTDAWESLKSMAISQANLIDSWTGIALDDSSYHTATALMNNADMSLIILVVYDGEVIYDVTETY